MKLKEFYQIAKKELEQLYGAELFDFRLEQVEYDHTSSLWDIVVSYLIERKDRLEVEDNILGASKYERIYKSLDINNDNEVVGFRIFDEAS